MSDKPDHYLTWMDFLTWDSTRNSGKSEAYCVHRDKTHRDGNIYTRVCTGTVDWMEMKTLYRWGKVYVRCSGLCIIHFNKLRAKGVPFVG